MIYCSLLTITQLNCWYQRKVLNICKIKKWCNRNSYMYCMSFICGKPMITQLQIPFSSAYDNFRSILVREELNPWKHLMTSWKLLNISKKLRIFIYKACVDSLNSHTWSLIEFDLLKSFKWFLNSWGLCLTDLRCLEFDF